MQRVLQASRRPELHRVKTCLYLPAVKTKAALPLPSPPLKGPEIRLPWLGHHDALVWHHYCQGNVLAHNNITSFSNIANIFL